VNNVELERRLRSAAVTYERVAPAAPDLERRIFARIAVTPRESQPRGLFGRRSWAIQFLATAALLALAVAIAFLIRQAKLHETPQPVTSPSPQSLSVSGPGGWKYSAYGSMMKSEPMLTPTVGWQLCPISRTTDGGAHWADVTPRGLDPCSQVDYLDVTHAWILQDLGDRLVTFRTADGGTTWQQSTLSTANSTVDPKAEGAAVGVVDPYGIAGIQADFVDPLHGWLMVTRSGYDAQLKSIADAKLYRTADGGLHWQLEAVNSSAASHKPSEFGCDRFCLMAFASVSTGWITTMAPQPRPSLLVTHDGGVTWKLQTLPPPTANMGCPCYVDRPIFSDQDHGILMLWSAAPPFWQGHLLVTSDGGSTWTTRSLPGEAVWGTVGFYDANHGWVIAGPAVLLASYHGQTSSSQALPLPLYRTDDGGKTWVRVETDLKLQSKDGTLTELEFLDQTHGFATWSLSSGQGFTGYQLLKTTDGGRTWSVVFTSRSP